MQNLYKVNFVALYFRGNYVRVQNRVYSFMCTQLKLDLGIWSQVLIVMQ